MAVIMFVLGDERLRDQLIIVIWCHRLIRQLLLLSHVHEALGVLHLNLRLSDCRLLAISGLPVAHEAKDEGHELANDR